MKHTVTVFLLDDDPVFLTQLQAFLQEYLPEHSPFAFQLFSFGTTSAMLSAAASALPDLLITDIDLPDSENGISSADTLRTLVPDCSIIYLTSYLEYAPEIFETDPLYFVLKEQYRERLPDALRKFSEQYKKADRRVQLYSGGQLITALVDEIIYCEHIGKDVRIICRNCEYSVHSSLPDFQEQLPAEQFALCHKSFLVNLAHVHSLSSVQVTMDTGAVLTISRSFRDTFRQAHRLWISSLL